MKSRSVCLLACGCSGFLLCLVGCERRSPHVAPPEAPVATVSRPVARQVTDYVDFTGRTQAVNSVNVVARANGYLVEEPFKEGSDVKKGDLLCEIDPRPYQAQYDQAAAQVNLYKAQLKLAEVTLARDEQLLHSTLGAVSAQQLDQDRAAADQADAQVKTALASLAVYKLNLDFCKVTSPIDGQVSRYYLTLGNLVTQDQTLLTTVVSLDPMYAYVDVDEPTVLRVRRAINAGLIMPYATGQIPILMGLQGEEGFPRKGVVDFVNNQVNPTTGSILARGRFDNPLPPGGRRLLLPGMFVRIRLPIGQPHPALLVVDRAILSDQDLKFVYVVDAQTKKVQSRRVTTGSLESDGLRVITDGLNADDLVVVGALQQVRPDTEIQTEPISMLSLLPGREAKNGKAAAAAKADTKATGTATIVLSALGADVDTAESNLTYTWAATTVPKSAAAPTFSVNGSNAAKNTTATLNKAGTYGFTVTIADSGRLSVTSSVSLAVPQTLATIAVSPAAATVNPEATQPFTATGHDQFGSPLATQPRFAWTTTVGKISEEGVLTAQNSPGKGTVTATSGTLHNASDVTVTNHVPTVAMPASATLKP
ncbi:MAG: efflux RND transporter periplasmic adaptor subunit [Thermoguttaceae bacterium]